MADPFIVDVERIGRVELEGTGPWLVHEIGRGSFTICDAFGRPARPTVWRKLPGGSGNGTKADANLIWASKSVPNSIVLAANSALEIP